MNENYEVKPYTKEEVEEIVAEVDDKLLDFINSDKYKDVLLMMGNLGKYSLTNQIYILLQNKNAVTVNGLKQWNYLGRGVLPGEKAIRIFAPIKEKEMRGVVDENGYPVFDENGDRLEREMEVIKGFKPSFVFDISQTQGRELDAFKFNEKITVKDKKTIIEGVQDVLNEKGFFLEFKDEKFLGKDCYGACDHQLKKVYILDGMSDLQTVSTLIHEAAHAVAHTPYRPWFEGITEKEKKEIKEIEAESIACVVCSHLGLDTENFNFSYISGWADGDISKFRRNMDVVGQHAITLIAGIDSAFSKVKIEEKIKKQQKEAIKKATKKATLSKNKENEMLAY